MQKRCADQHTAAGASEPARIAYIRGLDGLRATAVLAVLIFHADLGLYGGFLGVESFFVISGFLITALLLGDWSAHGRVRLGLFWWRRARRLLPALLALLAGTALATVLLIPAELGRLAGDTLAALGYATNWYLIAGGQPYFDPVTRPSLLRHLWSLAVEEQFYIIWPLVLGAGMRLLGARRLLALTILGALGSVALAVALFTPGADPSRIYYGADTRAAGLLLGAALAFVWAPGRAPALARMRWAGPALDAVGFMALLGLLGAYAVMGEGHPLLYRGGLAMVALLTAALVAATAHPAARLLPAALDLPPLRWVGLRSYSLYLWHWPIFMLTRPGLDLPDTWATQALRFGLAFALAAASYRFIELPIRRGALERAWASRGARPMPGAPRRPLLRVWAPTGAVVALSVATSYLGAQVADMAAPQAPAAHLHGERIVGSLPPSPQSFAAPPPARPSERGPAQSPGPLSERATPAAGLAAPSAESPPRGPTPAPVSSTAREAAALAQASPAPSVDSPALTDTPAVAAQAASPAPPAVTSSLAGPPDSGAELTLAPSPAAVDPRRARFDPNLAAELQAILDQALIRDDIPGAVVSVRLPDGSIWTGAGGLANIGARAAIAPEARVRIGSLSKIFTAVAVLQLVEEGRIGLDDPIAAWLPELLDDGDRITVRMLLQHTSGLHDYLEDPRIINQAFGSPDREWEPEDLVAYADSFPLRFAPGARGAWDYSSTNYVVLAMLIEHVTGDSLADVLDRRIFAPLGLDQTVSAIRNGVDDPDVSGYSYGTEHNNVSPTFSFGTANIVTTADDLRRFGEALFDGELLGPEIMAQMQGFVSGRGQYEMPALQYGLGLMANELSLGPGPDGRPRPAAERLVIGHIGGFNGFRAALWYAPQSDILIVLDANQSTIDPNDLAADLLDALLAAQEK